MSKIGAVLGPVGQVASMIMQIPQIIKQVWSSIKSFAQSIAKLFGWMTEEEKVQKNVLRDLGVEISIILKDQFRTLVEKISLPQMSLVMA